MGVRNSQVTKSGYDIKLRKFIATLGAIVITKLPQLGTTFALICNTSCPIYNACIFLWLGSLILIKTFVILGQGISPSQSLDSLILWLRVCKKIISTFASAMNTSFSKSWLKVSWPQPFSHMTPLSCYYVIFAKRCVSSFTTLMTIKLGRVMSYGKGPYLHFQLTCRTRDHVLFEKRMNSLTQGHRTQLEIPNIDILRIKSFFCYSKEY